MLYSILIYDSEAVVDQLDDAEVDRRLEHHLALQERFVARGGLGPVARLGPSAHGVTLRAGKPVQASGREPETLVTDGPFAETKEQLVGFYLLECDNLDDALEAARSLPLHTGGYEVRPIQWFRAGVLGPEPGPDTA